VLGLPRGLRVRAAPARPLHEACQGASAEADLAAAGLRPTSRREVWALGALCAASVLMTGHFFLRRLLFPAPPAPEPWRQGCRQCRSEWWQDFWRWRLEGLATGGAAATRQGAPPGLEWEWAEAANDTDWYGASAELVNSVVRDYADPALGPVLQIGCGDSPVPELLHLAGFQRSEHLDVAPRVIASMRARYPAAEWPGLKFEVRDFLAAGPPPPAHRFGAVVDKAGIWDWLQDEAPDGLPRLLAAVHRALVPGAQQGVYVLATKQAPADLAQTLARAAAVSNGQGAGSAGAFAVEATRPLGSKGIAWAYVLSPL